jgi:formylglycine-generating enzyme required for sulfatase activity
MRGLALLFVTACRLGFDESPLDSRDADLGSPDGSERCPSGKGPAMSVAADGFCIDNTEVTKAQYEQFLAASTPVDTSGRCAFNTDHSIRDYVNIAFTDPAQAVSGIDWCDARDFCAWSGKRLCGKIGGGPLAYPDHAAPDAQWYRACSQGGLMRRFSYGTTVDDTAHEGWCHLDDANNAPGQQAVVGSFPECVVVGTNVYDMLGNVQEWTDACETGSTNDGDDLCKVVGGVWYFGASYTDCDFFDPSGGMGIKRSMREKHTGFRCCAD